MSFQSSLKIAFILDPLAKLKIEKDSSVAMMAAAAARGHRIFACEQGDISLSGGVVACGVTTKASRLTARMSPCPIAE